MTETTRPARAKLSVTRSAAGISPSTGTEPRAVFGRMPIEAPSEMRTGPVDTSEDHGTSIAALLEPVRTQFNLADEGIADLAAFTRKLLSGGLPKGSQLQLARGGRF